MRNSRGCKCRCQHHHHKGCEENVETIVEPTVHCNIEDRHHHQRVRHIVPIVYHQRHHHHKHHEYVVKRKFTQDHQHHEHGRFEGDWCERDRGRCGRGESHGHGHEQHGDEEFVM